MGNVKMGNVLLSQINDIISRNSMLQHSFYQDWLAGRLHMDDLQYYALQWLHVERYFTRFLSAAHMQCDDLEARKVLAQNLYEEEGDSNKGIDSHLELWIDYAHGLGVTDDDIAHSKINEHTLALIEFYKEICANCGWRAAACAMFAYESQIPEVARTKVESLSKSYGISCPKTLKFFELHAEADKWHSQAWANLIEKYDDISTDASLQATQKACNSLLGFLDGMDEFRKMAGRKAGAPVMCIR